MTADVSRETRERLDQFTQLLLKWSARINLISPGTERDVFERHIVDCLQVLERAPQWALWADLGTGAGLPGLVVAIAADGAGRTVLVESDKRKAEFCRAVIRKLGLNAEVVAERIETVPPLGADVVSARALAPLPRLLGYVARHLAPGGTAILHKGAECDREIEVALASWRFTVEKVPSRTNPQSVLLRIGDLVRA